MSKTRLVKEISQFTAPQLVELICDAYDAKGVTAKEYFEYYLNPDEQRLYGKSVEGIVKCMSRVKRRRAAFRISKVKELIARMDAFKVDPALVARAMIIAVGEAVDVSCGYTFTEAQNSGVVRFFNAMLVYADTHGLLATLLPDIEESITPSRRHTINRALPGSLRSALADYDPFSTIGAQATGLP